MTYPFGNRTANSEDNKKKMVYISYNFLYISLISPNNPGLHTVPSVVMHHNCVQSHDAHVQMMHMLEPTCYLFITFINLNMNEWNRLVNGYTIYIEKCKIVMLFQHSLGYSKFTKKEHVHPFDGTAHNIYTLFSSKLAEIMRLKFIYAQK